MSSCDALDVQVKTQSPPYRRARETRTDSINHDYIKPNYCKAEDMGLVKCPDGWCRCSGALHKQVTTVDHPWGAPDPTPLNPRPSKKTKAELDVEARGAATARAGMRGPLKSALDAVIKTAQANDATLAEDERERIKELEEWFALLNAE